MNQESSRPPTPPPLPPPQERKEKMSVALKVRSAPPGWAFESYIETSEWDSITPPAGKYFFYGTLQDPRMLGEILDLPSLPTLQPAYMVGYRTRLWGQYPAVIKEQGAVIRGSMFEVPDERSAQKLADYETRNYRPTPCRIRLCVEDGEEKIVRGYVFEYCGNPGDLSDGTFDLGVWLKRMGRSSMDSQSQTPNGASAT